VLYKQPYRQKQFSTPAWFSGQIDTQKLKQIHTAPSQSRPMNAQPALHQDSALSMHRRFFYTKSAFAWRVLESLGWLEK
jgi:hypothetical protein